MSDSELYNEISCLLRQELAAQQIHIEGSGCHFRLTIVSPHFVGKTMLAQHRMVNELLKSYIQSEAIHALSLNTFTPDAWQQQG